MEPTTEPTPINSKKEEVAPKGFKLKYEAFKQLELFVPAVRKIHSCTTYPDFKVAYQIKRLCEALQKEMDNYIDLTKTIPEAPGEERNKKLDELHAMEVDIKWSRIPVEAIECVKGISPSDLVALEHIADLSSLQ